MADQLTLPNLFILGAAKAGTTALFDLFYQVPEVYLPFSKEPFFFNNDEHYEHGLEWYSQTFYPDTASYQYRCDATPHYLYWSEKVAIRMKRAYSSAPRMIVIMRDPVARAYSWYWNMVREGKETLSFEQALQAEEKRLSEQYPEFSRLGSMACGYVRGSRYAAQIKPFLEVFPRENFFYILSNDLRDRPDQTVDNLFDFLGLPPRQLRLRGKNLASLPRSMALQRWLRKKTTWRDMLKPLLPIQVRFAVKERIIRLNQRTTQYPEMNPETASRLRAVFTPDILALEQIIDRDLSAWRTP